MNPIQQIVSIAFIAFLIFGLPGIVATWGLRRAIANGHIRKRGAWDVVSFWLFAYIFNFCLPAAGWYLIWSMTNLDR